MKKCSQQRSGNHKEEPNGNSGTQKHNNKNKLEYKKELNIRIEMIEVKVCEPEVCSTKTSHAEQYTKNKFKI